MRIIHPSQIKPIRKKVGLTQTELAEASEVSQAYVAKIESGKADPKISTLKRISDALEENTEQEEITAEEVMKKPIISIKPSDNIKKAIKLMEAHDISQIPVLKYKKPVGSLAEETIIRKISSGGNLFKLVNENVEKIMEDPFPSVGPDADIETILHLLEHNPAVLVLKKGDPVGIITKADLLQLPTAYR